MVDLAAGSDVDIFVYLGGEQEVPHDIKHVIIDESVKIIPPRAFWNRTKLISVKFHNGIEKIEGGAFNRCWSLRRATLLGVREIGKCAFSSCVGLSKMEFGDKLETIGQGAFDFCAALRRIVIPLKDDMFPLFGRHQRYTQFEYCVNLTAVDVAITGIHKTVSSFLLENWRDEIKEEIGCINQILPKTPHSDKTAQISQWIRSVLGRIEHYKAEHNRLLQEATALLELALWKAKLDEKGDGDTKGDVTTEGAIVVEKSGRSDRRITSGASIVIKNVLPFIQLE
ncbi:hypothetical protein QTG54_011175 [Skeletonema marinoi]|uniref:Leucine-rich repeat domain-containing protein n=1 Tax=Skeletonema marinoi TaxID=267567 RepID=A0AAD8Y321_9STRA|nr:hypothetical protein QTG54_011175 [Skeletonema marinoi]